MVGEWNQAGWVQSGPEFSSRQVGSGYSCEVLKGVMGEGGY